MKEGLPKPEERKQTLADTIKSVAAAFFGVQNSANRKRDFTYGKASHFIVVGIIMTVLFIVGLVLVVKLMMKNAGM